MLACCTTQRNMTLVLLNELASFVVPLAPLKQTLFLQEKFLHWIERRTVSQHLVAQFAYHWCGSVVLNVVSETLKESAIASAAGVCEHLLQFLLKNGIRDHLLKHVDVLLKRVGCGSVVVQKPCQLDQKGLVSVRRRVNHGHVRLASPDEAVELVMILLEDIR